jgi:predicted dehydrogenase
MTNEDYIKLGIIGCGFATKLVYGGSKHVPNVKIVAAVDPHITRARKFAGREHSYKTTEEMYKNEDLDAVYIATPPYLHKQMIEEALKERKHVLCEKPISGTVEDAREIQRLDKNYSDLKVGINYQYRYEANCYNMVSGIKKNHLGKIYYANCNVFFSRNLEYFKKGDWRTRIETAGGGTLLSHGSHMLDLLIWAFGEPISAFGAIDNLKFKDIEIEDTGFGIIKFQNGIYCQINDSMITKPMNKAFDNLNELYIFGEKGNCYLIEPWPFSSLKWDWVDNYKIKRSKPGVSDYSECLNAFCNWILNDEPFLNTVEESSKVLRLVKAIYKSSQTGKEQKIEEL